MKPTIRLRKLENKDIQYMQEWMIDSEIMKWFRLPPNSMEENNIKEFIKKAKTGIGEGGDIHYAIINPEDEYLGTISLKNIDINVRKAEYAIVLRRKAMGKGIGEEATRLILKKAFMDEGLNRIYLNVLSENLNAIKMYKKCGFIFEGEFRNHILIKGKLKSLKWYAVLKEDYIREN